MRLVQFIDGGETRVGVVSADGARVAPLAGTQTVHGLARVAIAAKRTLEQVVASQKPGPDVSYADLVRESRLLPPLTHPDPAHCFITGTGLTHLGSAAARNAMHEKTNKQDSELTDSMKMFKWGVEGGRPTGSTPGVQPEWFYKGNGTNLRACMQPISSPDFALDHGEEPEMVGLYVIGDDGKPYRIGFAIGNEFSDHVTERQNYLYLAHSKLRQCGVGPMLNTGELPASLEGTSRIRRKGEIIWQKPFITGEANMCHSLANLEYHHFKYAQHRVPGDVHLHFFGTATVSCADGIRVEAGDIFEIDLPPLGAPLMNPVAVEPGGFALGGVGLI
jgi:hypothetical protein